MYTGTFDVVLFSGLTADDKSTSVKRVAKKLKKLQEYDVATLTRRTSDHVCWLSTASTQSVKMFLILVC